MGQVLYPQPETIRCNVLSLPVTERPREKLARLGVSSLSNQELIAIVLGSGIQKQNVFQLAKKVLEVFSKVSPDNSKMLYLELLKIKGIGASKASLLTVILEISRRRLSPKSLRIYTPKEVFHLLTDFKDKKKEYVISIYLNANREFLNKKVIGLGNQNMAYIDSKEIFREALLLNASIIILAHNHPGGTLDPSPQDIQVTKKLVMAAKHLQLQIIDHLIFTQNDYFSFYQNGLLTSD